MVYNDRGEAVFSTADADEFCLLDGYLFVLTDGLLAIYDDSGECVR